MIRYNHTHSMQEQFSYEDENGNETRLWISHETGDLHIRTDGTEKIIPFEVGIKIIDLLRTKQEIFTESQKLDFMDKIYVKFFK